MSAPNYRYRIVGRREGQSEDSISYYETEEKALEMYEHACRLLWMAPIEHIRIEKAEWAALPPDGRELTAHKMSEQAP